MVSVQWQIYSCWRNRKSLFLPISRRFAPGYLLVVEQEQLVGRRRTSGVGKIADLSENGSESEKSKFPIAFVEICAAIINKCLSFIWQNVTDF